MPLKWKLTRGFFISLLLAIGFGAVALLIGNQRIARFDQWAIGHVQGWESPGLTILMKSFTWIGSGLVVAALGLVVAFLLYKVLRHRQELIFFIGVSGSSALLNLALKLVFRRERPTLHRLIEETGFSFPSGHSMAAFTFYGVLAYLLWRHIGRLWGQVLLIIGCAIFILGIGVSRIYLGVHYPSDIMGGYLASGTWLCLSIWIFEHRRERKAGVGG